MQWKWFDLDSNTGVLESNLTDYRLDLELMVWFGDGYSEPTRAAWLHSVTGKPLFWVDVPSGKS